MSDLVTRAFLLASELHASQPRKASIVPGAPYLSHLMEVAGMVQANGGSPEAVAAALLHDAIEDVKRIDVRDTIFHQCGSEVLALVEECTEIGTGAGAVKASWHDRKRAYLDQIAECSAEALLIKIADKLQSIREVKRQVRISGDNAYAAFVRKEYATVPERKRATLWFQRTFAEACRKRLAYLGETVHVPAYAGIDALLQDFYEVVDWLDAQ